MRTAQQLLDRYWRAQARVGLTAYVESIAEWQRVNPVSVTESATAWLAAVLAIVRGQRRQSRSVAIAFYRLYRALTTGHTLTLPGRPPGTTTLGELRDLWAGASGDERRLYPDDRRVIPEDDFDWPEPDDERDDEAAITSLIATGVSRAYDLSERGRLDDPDFLADLESAGRGASQAADMQAIRSGRDIINGASQRDERALGWARVTDGDPCHFCAMLASRGAVYRSREAAGATSNDGVLPNSPERLQRYHPSCHCQVVPIYSRDQFWVPGSRELHEEWQRVARGLSGDDALRAWRRHIEAQRRERRANQ